jgi:hypothetical protein
METVIANLGMILRCKIQAFWIPAEECGYQRRRLKRITATQEQEEGSCYKRIREVPDVLRLDHMTFAR